MLLVRGKEDEGDRRGGERVRGERGESNRSEVRGKGL